MVKYKSYRDRPESEVVRFTDVNKESARHIFSKYEKEGGMLLMSEVLKVLEAYKIKIAEYKIVKDIEEALDAASDIGFPVVLKGVSPALVHKTEFKGVVLDIHNNDELITEYKELVRRLSAKGIQLDGVMIQRMYSGGKEGIIGASYDQSFGHILMFGMGGIYVETIKDVSFAIAPVTKAEVEHMITSIKSYPILRGVRGEPPIDFKSLEETIMRVYQMVEDFPLITELDLNPVFMMKDGCVCVDARIKLDPKAFYKLPG
jgi:acetyltransferase